MPQSDVGELNSRSPSLLTPTPPFPQETISISDDEDSVVEVKAKPFEGKVHFRDNDIPESAQPLETLSAKRVPRDRHGKGELRNSVDRQEDVDGVMVISAAIETKDETSAGHELEGRPAEGVTPQKEIKTWDFYTQRYKRVIRLPPILRLPEPNMLSAGPSANMSTRKTKPLGGLKPVNNLAQDRHIKSQSVNPPFKPHHQGPQLFDLHTEDKYKKQKLNNGSSTHGGSSTAPIDLEGSHSHRGSGNVNMSQGTSYTSQRLNRKERNVSEFGQFENIVRPGGSGGRARQRNNVSSGSRANTTDDQKGGSIGTQSRQQVFKHGDTILQPKTVIVDDIEDPISEDEPELPNAQKTPARYAFVITPSPAKRSLDEVEENMNKPIAKRRLRSSETAAKDSGSVSAYWSTAQSSKQASRSANSQSKQRSSANVSRSLTNNRQSGTHTSGSRVASDNPGSELSPDELGDPNPDSTDRKVARDLMGNLKKKKASHQTSDNISDAESPINTSSGEDNDLKNNIKQSDFKKSENLTKEHTFRVKQAYCLQEVWLGLGCKSGSGNQNFKTHALIIMNSRGGLVKQLQMTALQKVQYSNGSSKVMLSKPADRPGEQSILLDLGSIVEARNFVMCLEQHYSGIKMIEKTPDHLNTVFLRALPSEHQKKRRLSPVADDVNLIQNNVERRHAAERVKAQQGRSKPGGRRLIDSMVRIELMPPDEPRERRAKDFFNTSDEPSPPDTNITHATRASTRTTRCERSQTPPPPLRWTDVHKGWERKWNKSIVYPDQGKNRSTVDAQDIYRLDEDEFLNDNLIQFYLNFLEQRLIAHKPKTAERVLFMSSFFYLRLASGVPGKANINYSAVERWTSKIDVFKYDYIVVPVNEAAHWYLAIICNASKIIPERPTHGEADSEVVNQLPEAQAAAQETEAPGSDPDVDTKLKVMSLDERGPGPRTVDLTQATVSRKGKRKSLPKPIDVLKPRIITLDSLDNPHPGTCRNLKQWLIAEAHAKRKEEDVSSDDILSMPGKGFPLQPNYCDCGVFLLMYLEKFLDNPDDFVLGILSGRNTAKNRVLLPTAPDKRNEIRELLLHLKDNRQAPIEELLAIADKYALPPPPPIKVHTIEDSNDASQLEPDELVEGLHADDHGVKARLTNRLTNRLTALRNEKIEEPQPSDSASDEIISMAENMMGVNEKQEVNITEREAPRRSQSMVRRVFGSIKDTLTGSRQDKSISRDDSPTETTKVSPRLRDPRLASFEDVGLSRRSVTPQHSPENGYEEPRHLSNPEAQLDDSQYDETDEEAQSDPAAHPDSSLKSSTTNTADHIVEIESDKEEPRNNEFRSPSRKIKLPAEIKDSQDEDRDMLLLNHEDSARDDGHASYMNHDDRSPNSTTLAKVASPELITRQQGHGRSQQEPEMAPPTRISPRTRDRKRKSEEHARSSPSKSRKQRQPEVQQHSHQASSHSIDASDAAIIGSRGHKKLSTHIHFDGEKA